MTLTGEFVHPRTSCILRASEMYVLLLNHHSSFDCTIFFPIALLLHWLRSTPSLNPSDFVDFSTNAVA